MHRRLLTALFLSASIAAPVLSAPVITSISPSGGPTAGGIPITIIGTSFGSAPGTVSIGNAPAAIGEWTDSRILGTVPAGNSGEAAVIVYAGGVASREAIFTYASPQITSIDPASGPTIGGTRLTIHGSNFGTATGSRVTTIGDFEAPQAEYLGHERLVVTTPGDAPGAQPVVVRLNGRVSNAVPYTYVDPPAVTGVTPGGGPTRGGTLITITGSNFGGSGVVTFGWNVAPVVSWSPGLIVCTSPEGDPGPFQVMVTTAGTSSAPAEFDYDAPVIHSLTPDRGAAAGGTIITIRGDNFGRSDALRETRFGESPAPEVAWRGHDEIIVFSPPGQPGQVVPVELVFPDLHSNSTPFVYLSNSGAPDGPPLAFAVRQNEPNPVVSDTRIRFDLPEAAPWSLAVFDVRGRLVRRLAGAAPAGANGVRWDATDETGQRVPAGLYFYRLAAGDRWSAARRMLVTR